MVVVVVDVRLAAAGAADNQSNATTAKRRATCLVNVLKEAVAAAAAAAEAAEVAEVRCNVTSVKITVTWRENALPKQYNGPELRNIGKFECRSFRPSHSSHSCLY